MPEFGNKGNRISSQNEEFIILFLLEVRKAFSEFCKHTFFSGSCCFFNVSVFILKCFFLVSLGTNIQQSARLVFIQLQIFQVLCVLG